MTFVDNNHHAATALRNNVSQLLGNDEGSTRARVHRRSAWQFLDQCESKVEARWDVIFLDPPFDSGFLNRALGTIVERNLLKEYGKVYVELRTNASLDHPGWRVAKKSRAGDTQFSLLAREF